MKLASQVTWENQNHILPLKSALNIFGTEVKPNFSCFLRFFDELHHSYSEMAYLIFLFRRKYEFQQFMGCDDNAAGPIIPSQGRSVSLAQCSSSYYHALMDKKPSERFPGKTRIGNAFRNSWGRKDSEHKSKKSTSLVIFPLTNASSISHLLNEHKKLLFEPVHEHSVPHILNFYVAFCSPFSNSSQRWEE